MADTSGAGRDDWALGQRVGALVVALFWALPFFGVIDLLVGVVPDQFPDEYDWTSIAVVSTSWGLLFTILVPVPLVAWAIRPMAWVGPQVVIIAAAVLVAGLAALSPGQVAVALVVAASAAFPRMWRPGPGWPPRRLLLGRVFWPVHSLLVLGLAAALREAWVVLDAARGGAADDITHGLEHLPMQAGFTLAVPLAAAAAVLAMANRVVGWWFAVVPPAISAVWFGALCASHPDLVGSLGATRGWCTAAWGVVIAVAVWGTGYSTRAAGTELRETRAP
jgi:hypothetical protein